METSDSDSHKSIGSSELGVDSSLNPSELDQDSTYEQQQKQRLERLSHAFLERSKDYLQADLELTLQDYSLLQSMNKATSEVSLFHF
jgi:hypothetical protein